MQFAPVVVAGVVGTVLGHCRYYAGKLWAKRLKRLANRYGKWLGISAKDIGVEELVLTSTAIKLCSSAALCQEST